VADTASNRQQWQRARGQAEEGWQPEHITGGKLPVGFEGHGSQGGLADNIDAGLQGRLCRRPDEERQSQHGHAGRYGTTGFWSNADWIDCKDGKTRPVEPGTFPLAYGSTARVGRLRAYGNAIVPQVAQAFIESYLNT
jgi:DNA (cytosine-5)-methyltransferase 1